MPYVERNGVRKEVPYGGSRMIRLNRWNFDDPLADDFYHLTPASKRDPDWQEKVLVALTKWRSPRPWTSKYVRPVIAALLELTF